MFGNVSLCKQNSVTLRQLYVFYYSPTDCHDPEGCKNCRPPHTKLYNGQPDAILAATLPMSLLLAIHE